MALTTEQITDLENLKTLSTHVVSIIDNQSKIDTALRQLTTANITELNDLYGNIVQVINQIVESQIVV